MRSADRSQRRMGVSGNVVGPATVGAGDELTNDHTDVMVGSVCAVRERATTLAQGGKTTSGSRTWGESKRA